MTEDIIPGDPNQPQKPPLEGQHIEIGDTVEPTPVAAEPDHPASIDQDDSTQGSESTDLSSGEDPEDDTFAYNEDGSKRQDHAKASTMASVLKEDKGLDHLITNQAEDREFTEKYVESGRAAAERTDMERRHLRDAKRAVKAYQARGEDVPPRVLEEVDDDEAELRAEENRANEAEYDNLNHRREEMGKELDQRLSPYEEVYDLNPDYFAKMPTEQFMEITRELIEADRAIRQAKGSLQSAQRDREEVILEIKRGSAINRGRKPATDSTS